MHTVLLPHFSCAALSIRRPRSSWPLLLIDKHPGVEEHRRVENRKKRLGHGVLLHVERPVRGEEDLGGLDLKSTHLLDHHVFRERPRGAAELALELRRQQRLGLAAGLRSEVKY